MLSMFILFLCFIVHRSLALDYFSSGMVGVDVQSTNLVSLHAGGRFRVASNWTTSVVHGDQGFMYSTFVISSENSIVYSEYVNVSLALNKQEFQLRSIGARNWTAVAAGGRLFRGIIVGAAASSKGLLAVQFVQPMFGNVDVMLVDAKTGVNVSLVAQSRYTGATPAFSRDGSVLFLCTIPRSASSYASLNAFQIIKRGGSRVQIQLRWSTPLNMSFRFPGDFGAIVVDDVGRRVWMALGYSYPKLYSFDINSGDLIGRFDQRFVATQARVSVDGSLLYVSLPNGIVAYSARESGTIHVPVWSYRPPTTTMQMVDALVVVPSSGYVLSKYFDVTAPNVSVVVALDGSTGLLQWQLVLQQGPVYDVQFAVAKRTALLTMQTIDSNDYFVYAIDVNNGTARLVSSRALTANIGGVLCADGTYVAQYCLYKPPIEQIGTTISTSDFSKWL